MTDHGKHRTLCGVESRCFMQTALQRKTETANEKRDMFGLERLKAFVEKYQALSANEIRLALLEELKSFAHGAPQADDITILVMKF